MSRQHISALSQHQKFLQDPLQPLSLVNHLQAFLQVLNSKLPRNTLFLSKLYNRSPQ